MRVWRGEKIDWDRLEEQHMPKKYCPGCCILKPKQEYHLCEWHKDNERGNCKACIAQRIKDGAPLECNTCNEWLCKEAFEPHQRDHQSTHTRICINCLETRKCINCERWQHKTGFSLGEWERARQNDGRGKCKACCVRSPDGIWFCKGCQIRKPIDAFSMWIMTHGHKQDKSTRCDTCKDKHEEDEQRMRQANTGMVIPADAQPSFASQPINVNTACKYMVTIFCPECGNSKEVDMNMFWRKTNERHRLQQINCVSCKRFHRLGKWQRHSHQAHNTIDKWLKHNDVYYQTERPATVTVDLYLTQDINIKTIHKRSTPDGANQHSCNRQKNMKNMDTNKLLLLNI